MKIIRVRRGFITNSSSSSEWTEASKTPAATLPEESGSNNSVPTPSAIPALKIGEKITLLPTSHSETQANTTSPTTVNNIVTFSGVAVLLVLVFAGEKLWQVVQKRRK